MPDSNAKRLFDELRSSAIGPVSETGEFRSHAISGFVTFLKHAVPGFEYPWDQFPVPRDLKLCIQYTDERRGAGLIKTITNLIIELLMGEIDLAIIFRDENNPIFTEQSPASKKAFRVFKTAGGHFVALHSEWLADFYALVKLRKAATEVTEYLLEDDTRVKVTVEEFQAFLAQEFQSGFVEVLAELIRLAEVQDQEDEEFGAPLVARHPARRAIPRSVPGSGQPVAHPNPVGPTD